MSAIPAPRKGLQMKSFNFSFDAAASAIMEALEACDAVSARASTLIVITIQQYLDSATASGVKRVQASCEAIGQAVRDAFVDYVAMGQIEGKTVTEYAQGAQRAFFFDCPWTPGIKNDADKKLPWSKKAGKSGAKSGKVSTTDTAALILTIRKGIEQAMLLNLLECKGGLIDLAVELDPEFKV